MKRVLFPVMAILVAAIGLVGYSTATGDAKITSTTLSSTTTMIR